MAMTVDSGGGGGLGTAGSICTISPADNEAIINNLISRIEKLEFDLSQITGANLHSNTLSDLSSQVGWVYGVEYMGQPGWIQTEYGTLIPPPGFSLLGSGITLSDGNTYNAVLMDSDGVLQYGFGSDGTLSGASVTRGDYAIFSAGASSGGNNSTPPQVHLNGITEISNTFSTAQVSTPFVAQSATWTVTHAGLYIITVTASERIFNTTGSADALFSATINSQDGVSIRLVHDITYYHNTAEVLNRAAGSTSWPLRLNQGQSATIGISPGFYGSGTAGQYAITEIHVSMVWVGQ